MLTIVISLSFKYSMMFILYQNLPLSILYVNFVHENIVFLVSGNKIQNFVVLFSIKAILAHEASYLNDQWVNSSSKTDSCVNFFLPKKYSIIMSNVSINVYVSYLIRSLILYFAFFALYAYLFTICYRLVFPHSMIAFNICLITHSHLFIEFQPYLKTLHSDCDY